MPYLLMIVILGAVQILTMVIPIGCEAASELLRLRRVVLQTNSGPITRLVLDITGDRPTNVDSTSPDALVISFQELRSKLNPEVILTDPNWSVTSIKILVAEKGSKVLVQLRSPGSAVSHSYVPPESPKPGLYQMLVEIRRPPKQNVSESTDKESKTGVKSSEKGPEPAKKDSPTASQKTADDSAKESKTAPNPVDHVGGSSDSPSNQVKQQREPTKYKEVPEANLSEPLKEANRSLARGEFEQAYNNYSRLLSTSALSEPEVPIALYGLADSYFFMHREGLSKVLEQVVTNYMTALKAEPWMTQAAWALYRLGLAYQATQDHVRAIAAFEKVVEDYPKHPALPLCWLGLGVSYQKTASHPQAIRALKSLLESPRDQSQKVFAHWLLGASLYATGEYAAAIDSFEGCLAEVPTWYVEQPMLLKYLGESYFHLKQYYKTRDYLLWYLNLEYGLREKDLILAKIAEVFLIQDEQAFANKIYDHIRSQYPDSEGDLIAQIRNADFLQSKGRISREDDLGLFRELASKPLSRQLSRLVNFKLASREYKYGNFEESLQILDRILQDETSKTSNDDAQSLRSKVLVDWAKYAFQNHDFGRVIQVFEGNQSTFAENAPLELHLVIAESYASMKQHKKALSVYQKLLTKPGAVPGEDVLVKMAECCVQAEDFESALQFCNQIKGSQFQQKKTQLLAQVYFTQRQYSKVIECMDSLSEKDIAATNNPNLAAMYGESLYQLGECEKAIPWLQKSSEQMQKAGTHPDEVLPLSIAQATCYSKLKKFDKAIAVLENAAAIASTENLKDQLNYDISKYYLESGQKDKAIQKLTKLKSSTQSFWQTAAKQQLDYIEVQGK
jgi:tetratricopeptide (TPR) repeat protein